MVYQYEDAEAEMDASLLPNVKSRGVSLLGASILSALQAALAVSAARDRGSLVFMA
jgi:hypothetical protein